MINKNDISESLHKLKKHVEQYPDDSGKLVELGAFIITTSANSDEAICYLKRALIANPLNIDALFWLAVYYYYQYGDSTSAKPLLEKAVVLDADRGDCLLLLFYVIWDIEGEKTKALPYLLRAIKVEPDWITPRQELATHFLKANQLKLAEEEVKKALAHLKDLPVPNDPVKEYFERGFTGRIYYNDRKAKLIDLLDKIIKASKLLTKD